MPLGRKKYVCPVCGFLLKYPPTDFNICPSCGVEFGADDVDHSIYELQRMWIDRGMPWSSPAVPQPADFRPLAQLKNLEAPTATEMGPVTDVISINRSDTIRARAVGNGTFGNVRLCFA